MTPRPFRDAAWHYAEYRYRPTDAFLEQLAAHLGWTTGDVREVVVMDPEPAMLEEGRRRAADAGVDNLAFVLGGSDDLARLSRRLGPLTAAVISQAFHWMADQDAVLRALHPLLDHERGAIALVGYVKEPDSDRVWPNRPPWTIVDSILRRHLDPGQESSSPGPRHDPFPEILARSSFSEIELMTHEYETELRPSIGAAIGLNYALGNLLPRLGDRRAQLEADVREALADADSTPTYVRLVDSALVGRRPTAARSPAPSRS